MLRLLLGPEQTTGEPKPAFFSAVTSARVCHSSSEHKFASVGRAELRNHLSAMSLLQVSSPWPLEEPEGAEKTQVRVQFYLFFYLTYSEEEVSGLVSNKHVSWRRFSNSFTFYWFCFSPQCWGSSPRLHER